MHEGHVPERWKEAHIIALQNKLNPKNYKPVSLTSVCETIMESVIKDSIVAYILANDLFVDQQYGFVPNRTCMTQLLCVMEDWTKWLDSSKCIDTICFDFQKAFDSVPYERLWSKLSAYGIIGKTAKWVWNFLTNRHQRVIVENGKSEWADITSGIPQGSVLGPTIFVTFYKWPSWCST